MSYFPFSCSPANPVIYMAACELNGTCSDVLCVGRRLAGGHVLRTPNVNRSHRLDSSHSVSPTELVARLNDIYARVTSELSLAALLSRSPSSSPRSAAPSDRSDYAHALSTPPTMGLSCAIQPSSHSSLSSVFDVRPINIDV